jgi:hypothetical protein
LLNRSHFESEKDGANVVIGRRHNSALLGSIGNQHASCAYSKSQKTLETAMMMNDLREPAAAPVDGGSTPKIVAALVVALGFGGMAAYTYETGTWNSQPKQVVASKEAPPPAPLENAAASEAPLQSAADLPPLPPPTPVKDVPAQASAKPAAAPAIRVARAQAPAPALSQTPAVQPAATVSAQPSPEAAAPAASTPEPAAPQPAALAAPAAPQEAPAQEAPAASPPQ